MQHRQVASGVLIKMITIVRVNGFGLGQFYREWIPVGAVDTELVVQVWSCRQSRATDIANNLTLFDFLAAARTSCVAV